MSTVDELFERYKATFLTGQGNDPTPFLEQLSGSDRRELEALWDEENQLLPVTITSAVELDEQTAREIGDQIAEQTGRKIELSQEVDPDVLGGLVVQAGNTVMDASVRRRLDNLRREVARAA